MSASTPTPPRWPRVRCATRADARGDQMLGTAFPAARLLLVEQPFPWDSEGLRTSRFDRETALALEARCRAESIRVQAIRRPGRNVERAHRRWAIVDARAGRQRVHWGEFAADAELLSLALDGSDGEPADGPLHLVCTHGKHDPCCAQRGRPVTAALAALRPADVWQASHLGGCRFAPTVLVLPLGLMYGRVSASDAPRLIRAADAGEVVLERLRGRIGIPPAAQAAIAHVHEQLALHRARDVTLVATTPVDGATVEVRIDTPAGRFDVTVTRERVDAVELTCAHPGPSWFVAHRPAAMRPVS